jgi:YVTN family beta-propeller protein
MKINVIWTGLLLSGSILCVAQSRYSHDRVYTANQVSNSVSVIDPATNSFLGEISLGKPYPNVLSPLYRGQALVHGLRYLPSKKLLAVVSIGSNSVTFLNTETNKIIENVYVGRSPHEPTFTPDGRQLWVSLRGESYISVIEVSTFKEIKKVPVADGPGMVSFSPDGKLAYICSSFTAELDIVDTSTFAIIKKVPVISPFSPNIFTSQDGKYIALTHKDVGKVSVFSTDSQKIINVLTTGPITNHVTFTVVNGTQLMLVTVGGDNKILIFDPAQDFKLTNTIMVGALPHGIWAAPDGKVAYVGLEYADQVQAIDLLTMKALPAVKIGQSPQALVYAENAVSDSGKTNLTPLNDASETQVIQLKNVSKKSGAQGKLAVRPIGLTDLVEQIFSGLEPDTPFTLALTKAHKAPYTTDYEINSFKSDLNGKFTGQSTGILKSVSRAGDAHDYKHIFLINNNTKEAVLVDSL